MSIAAMTRFRALAIVFLLSGIAYAAVNTCDNAAGDACYNAGMSESNIDAPSCTTVNKDLSPCINFIKGNENKPSMQCCSGAKQLNGVAKTKADRQTICECIKKAAALIGEFDASRIPLLVKDCGLSVKLPPITRNTDCSKVTFYEG